MENKKIVLFGVLFVLCIVFISMIHAGGVEISNKGVKFDSEILDNFNLTNTEKDFFLKGDLKSIFPKGIGWVYVTVDIKDTSNITIPNRNSPDFESKLSERKAIMTTINEAVLATLSEDEFKLKTKSEFGGFFSGNITKEGFDKLLKDERVDHIYAEKYIESHLAESAPLINADDAWGSGYNGTGQTVCVIDTGVDYTRSDLGACYGGGGCKILGGYDYYNGDPIPWDDHGHGTNVAGIIISNDSIHKGIAHGAKIVALKASNENNIFNQDAVKSSLEWCLNNAGIYNISVVSMSFGTIPSIIGVCSQDFADDEINLLYDAGIFLVASSGNNGHQSKIGYPACQGNVTSVGAVFDANVGSQEPFCTFRDPILGICWSTCTDDITFANKITCFTNRGSLLNLLAPGASVYAAGRSYSGTSQASPMVSGAAALLLEKKPDLEPDEIKQILQDTGVNVGSWKRIDVEAALDSICVCNDWTIGSCGTGGCNSEQKPRTRSCDPSGCATESQCVYDASCEEEEEEGSGSTCNESGYFQCYEYEYGDCDVRIAANWYENVPNNIEWGAVNDGWDPYVIGEYKIGWKGVDAEQMYYDCDGDSDCHSGGCDCDEIADESTMITVTAPGTAHSDEILGYDDTESYWCTAWFNSFNPNYGAENLIYVLKCFDDGDCSSNKYCDNSSTWSNWDCVNDKSNSQSCTRDAQCSSNYCDNDGEGLSDDGWCFAPYNTYFDGQETSYCEYSTNYGIGDCDEKQTGTDLNICIGIPYHEEECGSTCDYQDITSIFECSESNCSCSQPLCDGLTAESNITNCSSEQVYFADKCGSAAAGEDRGDNICRSSTFISGCTASSECNGIEAGTGNCTSNCSYAPLQNDTNKFYIKNSSNNAIAWLGDGGNIVLKGRCFSGGNCDTPGDNSFIVRNSTNNNVAFINSTGDLCVVTGDCSDRSAFCNPMTDAFIIRNSSNYNMSYISFTGDLCLTGVLYENSEP